MNMTYIHEWTNQITFFMLMKKIYKWREKNPKRNLVTLRNEILITNDKF